MALWTTYLSFWTHNKAEILKKLGCTSKDHGARLYYVARKRGNDAVAPFKKTLDDFKNGTIDWSTYKFRYLGQIRGSDEAQDWMSDTAMECEDFEVILICFEKDAEHCHRTLLAKEMVLTWPSFVKYKGELSQLFEEA